MSKLYVGNVPEGAKEKEIKELFEAFGSVEEVALLRGYGFVHFVKQEDASAALNALDDSEFQGAHIQVQFARTKGHGYGRGSGAPRPRYSSGGGGGGGGGGRGYERDSGSRSYRDSSYRDNYRDRDRDRRYGYDDRSRTGGSSGGGRRYEDYYGGRYDYDAYRSSYDHYPGDYYEDRYRERDYYDDRYPRERDYYSSTKYGEYSRGGSGLDGRGRSRSPTRDYYSSKDRSSFYDRETEPFRSRRW